MGRRVNWDAIPDIVECEVLTDGSRSATIQHYADGRIKITPGDLLRSEDE